MDLILYYAPVACSLVPFVTLTEAGADFETRIISLAKHQNMSPDYLAINPKHKVPLLSVDGKTLSENVAIQQWIARTFPEANLLPKDPWQEMLAVSHLAWFASGIHPHLSRYNNPLGFCDVAGSEGRTKDIAKKYLHENFALVETLLQGREFFFDHFTACDAYFFWCFRRAGIFGDIDLGGFRACQAHLERMKARASVQKLLAFEKEAFAQIARS